MKRVAFDSSPHVSYEDARARFRHQSLLHDYLELQQETEAARDKLMALKQKKLTLLAEVRFLRQRHKFLLKNKSSGPKEHVIAKPQPIQFRKSKKEKARVEKHATFRNLQPVDKEKASRSIPYHEFDLNHGSALYGAKEQSIQRAIANQRVRINGPKVSVSPFLNSSATFRGQEHVIQSRKPAIDLNQISREEEELQERCEPFDPPTQGLMKKGFDENEDDVRLSTYRNVSGGYGSGGRPSKRKISWQDPVALRV